MSDSAGAKCKLGDGNHVFIFGFRELLSGPS
jgi:hypothetical protein